MPDMPRCHPSVPMAPVVVNHTPHPIVYQRPDGTRTTMPASRTTPRVSTVERPDDPVGEFACVTQQAGDVEGLPAAAPGVFRIVSRMVFDAAPERCDLICPDTGAGAVRDDKGRILAVTRFVRRDAATGTPEEKRRFHRRLLLDIQAVAFIHGIEGFEALAHLGRLLSAGAVDIRIAD